MADYNEIERLAGEVTNLDTARMTLRWALERLNSIEKEKAEFKKNLLIAQETKKELEAKIKGLEESFESRVKILGNKETFYHKLEATMQLLGEGKINIRHLIAKEARIDQVRSEFENDYQSKFEELDKRERKLINQWNKRILDLEEQYGGKLNEAQKKYDSLRSELREKYEDKISNLEKSFKLREKTLNLRVENLENSLKEGEVLVEERRKCLENEFINKKKTLEDNYLKTKALLENNLEKRVSLIEKEQLDKVKALENSWASERERILEEQKIREEQFIKAQDTIRELENNLADEREKHNTEFLNNINETENAFREKINKLEAEKRRYIETINKIKDESAVKAGELEAIAERKYQTVLKNELSKKEKEMEVLKSELSKAYGDIEEKKAVIEEISFKKAQMEKLLAESADAANKEAVELKSKYEREMVNLKADLSRAVSEAKSRGRELLILQDENEQIKNKLSDYSKYMVEKERALEKEYSNKKEELIRYSDEKIKNFDKELNLKFASEKKSWELEKRKLDELIENLREDNEKTRENEKRLSIENQKMSNDLIKAESNFNMKLTKMRAGYEDGIIVRINDAVKAATVNLRKKTEELQTSLKNMERTLLYKEDEIRKLLSENSEKDAVWNEKLRNIERDRVAVKVDEVKEDYENKKSRLEKEFALHKMELNEEYQKKAVEIEKMSALKAEYMEKEKDDLKQTTAKLSQQLLISNKRINEMELEISEINKKHHDKVREIEKESYEDFDMRINEAVNLKTEVLIAKLENAEEQMINIQRKKEDEINLLKENFEREKEKFIQEIEVRQHYLAEAENKIVSLQDDLEKYRERGSGMLINKMVDHEEHFARQLVEFNMKQAQIEKDYLAKAEELKKKYEARFKEQKEMLDKKDEFIEERENYLRRREKELGELEINFNIKKDELERMRTELTKVVMEYKMKNKGVYSGEGKQEFETKSKEREALLVSKLSAAEKRVSEIQKEREEEIKTLKEKLAGAGSGFDKKNKNAKLIEAANSKIEFLERELAGFRENFSKLTEQLAEQEKKFTSRITEFNQKQAKLKEEYLNKINAVKSEYEANIDKMKKSIKEKNEFIAQREEYFKRRAKEIALKETALNGKIDDFNNNIAKERFELIEKKAELDKKISENEIEFVKKMNELDKMKTELSKVINEYKRKGNIS